MGNVKLELEKRKVVCGTEELKALDTFSELLQRADGEKLGTPWMERRF